MPTGNSHTPLHYMGTTSTTSTQTDAHARSRSMTRSHVAAKACWQLVVGLAAGRASHTFLGVATHRFDWTKTSAFPVAPHPRVPCNVGQSSGSSPAGSSVQTESSNGNLVWENEGCAGSILSSEPYTGPSAVAPVPVWENTLCLTNSTPPSSNSTSESVSGRLLIGTQTCTIHKYPITVPCNRFHRTLQWQQFQDY